MEVVLYEYKFEIKNILLCLIPLIVALIIAIAGFRQMKNVSKVATVFKFSLSAVLILISAILCFSKIRNYKVMKDYLNSADCLTVKGEVTEFHPMPSSGHDHEHFEINGVYFEYSDYEIINGYHNAASKGGVITHNGQNLLIKYYHDEKKDKNIILYIVEERE